MMKNGMDVTMASFVDILKNGFKANTITILQLFREHNELFGKKIANGVVTGSTLEKYKITMGYVAAYIKTLKKDDIMVKEITPMFIEDFFVYLKCCFSHLNLCKALHKA